MSQVTISCPECAWETEADEALLGRRLKCPKCKESFIAEKAGLYDLVELPPPPRAATPPPAPESQGKPAKKTGRATPAPSSKPVAKDEPSVDDDFLANMEKWAEE